MNAALKKEFDRPVKAATDAHDRQDWLAAIDSWKAVIEIDPTYLHGYLMGGATLLAYGRIEEAETVLSRGVALDPNHVTLGVNHAMAATLLKNWPEAVRRWNELNRRTPKHPEVMAARAEAEMQIQLYRLDEEIDGDSEVDWRQFEAGRASNKNADLFNRFQSVGDNCEFGLVQRHFRAEPVSLLRWSGISLDALINGLDKGFAGIGCPTRTEIKVLYNEYVLEDHLYSTGMHTFLRPEMTRETPEELHLKMCKRQSFLGRKFIEDLEEPEHIFVFKSVNESTVERAMALHAAMRRYGPATLLFAVEARGRVAGSVEEIQPGLFIGAIDRFSRPGEGWDNLHWDRWRSVCQEVLRQVGESKPRFRFFDRIFQKARDQLRS